MYAIRRLLALLGFRRNGSRTYTLDDQTYSLLETLAETEQRPAEDVHTDILLNAYEHRRNQDALYQRWQLLSPREKDVTALSCLGYTNRQIAARLNVSPDTVKGYIRQALVKFNLHSKNDLRLLLFHWNFSEWGPQADI
jgi:DNA-binding CsgD family transcriptional regulator